MYLRGAKWVPGLCAISQEPGKILALCFMQNKFSLVKFWGESESRVLAASCKRSLGSRFIWRLIRLKSKKKKWVLVLDFPCLSGLSSSEPWRAQGPWQGPCQGLLAREKKEEGDSSLPRQGLDYAEDRQEHLLGFQTLPTANLVQAKEEQAGRAPDHDKNLKKSIV